MSKSPDSLIGKLAFFQYSRLVEKIWVLAPFSRPMRPSDFVLFTLKHSLFLDFYAKVLLIPFKRREVPNRQLYKAESSNINSYYLLSSIPLSYLIIKLKSKLIRL